MVRRWVERRVVFRSRSCNHVLIRQISESIIRITLTPGAARRLRRRQPVQGIVGVLHRLPADRVRLRYDFTVVLRSGVGVGHVDQVSRSIADRELRQLQHRIVGPRFAGRSTEPSAADCQQLIRRTVGRAADDGALRRKISHRVQPSHRIERPAEIRPRHRSRRRPRVRVLDAGHPDASSPSCSIKSRTQAD